MKKIMHFILIILFVFQIAGCAGSSDRVTGIPKLNELSDYNQEQLDEALLGHSIEEVHNSWGEPKSNLFGFWGEIWELSNNNPKKITCYYKNGVVAAVKISDLSKDASVSN